MLCLKRAQIPWSCSYRTAVMDAENRTLGSISVVSYLCMCIHRWTCYDMVVGVRGQDCAVRVSFQHGRPSNGTQASGKQQAACLAEPCFWLLAIIYWQVFSHHCKQLLPWCVQICVCKSVMSTPLGVGLIDSVFREHFKTLYLK